MAFVDSNSHARAVATSRGDAPCITTQFFRRLTFVVWSGEARDMLYASPLPMGSRRTPDRRRVAKGARAHIATHVGGLPRCRQDPAQALDGALCRGTVLGDELVHDESLDRG